MLATAELQSPQENARPRAFCNSARAEMQRTVGGTGNLFQIIVIGVMSLLLVNLNLY